MMNDRDHEWRNQEARRHRAGFGPHRARSVAQERPSGMDKAHMDRMFFVILLCCLGLTLAASTMVRALAG